LQKFFSINYIESKDSFFFSLLGGKWAEEFIFFVEGLEFTVTDLG